MTAEVERRPLFPLLHEEYGELEETPYLRAQDKLYRRLDKIKRCEGSGQEALRKWIRSIDKAYCSISGVSDCERDMMMMSFIGCTVKIGFSYSLLNALKRDGATRTWEYLRKVVVEEHMEEWDILEAKLRRLQQEPNESVYAFNKRYATELPWAYSKAHFENSIIQESMVRRYIDGIRDNDLAIRTLDKRPKTIQEAMFVAACAQYASDLAYGGRTKRKPPKPYNIVSYREMP